MGSKSKSKSSNTSQATQGTMNNLAKGAVPNEQVAGWQQDLANSQMSNAAGLFGSLVEDGMSMFGGNPMMNFMGSMLGMPARTETPDALKDFFAKYMQEPEPPAPQPQTQGAYGGSPYAKHGYGPGQYRRGMR